MIFPRHGSERQWTTEGFVTRFVPVKLQLKELKLTDCSDGLNRVVVTIGVRYRTVSILGHTCFDSDDFLLRHRNTICSSWSIPAVAVIWVFWPHATRNMCVKSNKEMRMTPVMNNPNEFKRTKRILTGESNQITTQFHHQRLFSKMSYHRPRLSEIRNGCRRERELLVRAQIAIRGL